MPKLYSMSQGEDGPAFYRTKREAIEGAKAATAGDDAVEEAEVIMHLAPSLSLDLLVAALNQRNWCLSQEAVAIVRRGKVVKAP